MFDARQQLCDKMMEEVEAEWLYQIRRAEERHNGVVVAIEETANGICIVVKSKEVK
jgi:hypothetical protein